MADRRRARIEAELKGLFGFALALTGERSQAEELVQETALKALQARRVPELDAGFRAWLFRILRNAAIDAKRAGRRMMPTDPAEVAERIDGGQSLSAAGNALADGVTLRSALADLKPLHREMIALVDISGFGYAEVAELLDIPVGTVMSRVSRARAALAESVADRVGDPGAGSNVLPLPSLRAGRRR